MVTLILCCMLAITDKTYLFVANYCSSCREAKNIIEDIAFDSVEIINIDDHKDLAEKYDITVVPTLVVDNRKYVGLQSEEKYRELLVKDNYTGVINFTNDQAKYCPVYTRIIKFAKLSRYSYKELDPNVNKFEVKRHKIKKIPTLLLLKDGKEVGRYTGITNYNN